MIYTILNLLSGYGLG